MAPCPALRRATRGRTAAGPVHAADPAFHPDGLAARRPLLDRLRTHGVRDRRHLPLIGLSDASRRDRLDDHIEAHVHGPVRLDRDAEAVVLDPAYRGTDVEAAAVALPFPVEWHHGWTRA